jgi:hypothetical protein
MSVAYVQFVNKQRIKRRQSFIAKVVAGGYAFLTFFLVTLLAVSYSYPAQTFIQEAFP